MSSKAAFAVMIACVGNPAVELLTTYGAGRDVSNVRKSLVLNGPISCAAGATDPKAAFGSIAICGSQYVELLSGPHETSPP